MKLHQYEAQSVNQSWSNLVPLINYCRFSATPLMVGQRFKWPQHGHGQVTRLRPTNKKTVASFFSKPWTCTISKFISRSDTKYGIKLGWKNSQESTVHGIRYFVDGENAFHKFAWFVIMGCSCSFLAYLIVDAWMWVGFLFLQIIVILAFHYQDIVLR